MPIYGSDEVSAVVLDMGTNTTRAGYAGEDTPKSIIPSSYGYIPGQSDDQQAKYFFGHAGPSIWRPQQQILNPLKDSIVEDWAAAEKLIENVLQDGIRIESLEENPLLVSEPAWNTSANKEKMCELAFEQWKTPAYYSVDKAVLASFASGRGTALVVDVGQDSSSVIPIYDGFVLKKGIQRSPIGGDLMSQLLQTHLRSSPVQINPHYLVKQKFPIEPRLASRAILHTNRIPNSGDPTCPTTPSFANYAEMQVMHDVKESICGMFEQAWNDAGAQAKGAKLYEFPDGYNDYYGANPRYVVPEVFHQPQQLLPKEYLQNPRPPTSSTIPLPQLSEAVPLPHMIINAVNACDADVLPQLLSNIVLVGGSTLLPGFAERLQFEINTVAAGFKTKLHAAGPSSERKYASWLGGSILASLGTFHQLWISKAEYEEHGKNIVLKRAK